MAKRYKSIQIFKNPYLEKLTHVHPLTPLVLWAPVVVGLLWKAMVQDGVSLYAVIAFGVMGLFFWTLTEYVMHRFIFHFEAEHPWMKRVHFLIHGIHHNDPGDPTRLVMPPAMSLILAPILYSLFRIILGPVWVIPFFAFFLIGYLCYDYIHFAVHHFVPRTRFGKMLKYNHMQHHFADPDTKWGVSSPLWDYVFGTVEGIKDKKSTI